MDIGSPKEYEKYLNHTRPKIEYSKEFGHHFSPQLNKAYKEVFGDYAMIKVDGVSNNLGN